MNSKTLFPNQKAFKTRYVCVCALGVLLAFLFLKTIQSVFFYIVNRDLSSSFSCYNVVVIIAHLGHCSWKPNCWVELQYVRYPPSESTESMDIMAPGTKVEVREERLAEPTSVNPCVCVYTHTLAIGISSTQGRRTPRMVDWDSDKVKGNGEVQLTTVKCVHVVEVLFNCSHQACPGIWFERVSGYWDFKLVSIVNCSSSVVNCNGV